jgi:hypothetical protein
MLARSTCRARIRRRGSAGCGRRPRPPTARPPSCAPVPSDHMTDREDRQ